LNRNEPAPVCSFLRCRVGRGSIQGMRSLQPWVPAAAIHESALVCAGSAMSDLVLRKFSHICGGAKKKAKRKVTREKTTVSSFAPAQGAAGKVRPGA